MRKDRTDAVEREYKESQQKGRQRYSYVKINKLERMGIEQFKPAVDNNFIRIVVNPDHDGFYGQRVSIHPNIGADNRTYICPKGTFGEKCPICEEVARMKKAGEEQDLIDALRAATRFLFFVVDTTSADTEEKGIQWFDAAPGIRDEIVTLSVDKRSGKPIDVSDPVEGKEIAFSRTGKRLKTRYKGFELVDPEVKLPKDIFDDVPLFEDVLQDTSYELLEEAFGGGSPPEDEGSTRGKRSSRSDEGDETRSSRRSRVEQEEDTPPEKEAPPEKESSRGRGRKSAEKEAEPEDEPKRGRRGSRKSEKEAEPEDEPKTSRGRGRAKSDEPAEESTSSSLRDRIRNRRTKTDEE